MKGPVALLLCTVITAVAFSAPLPIASEEEITKLLHSIRDEFLSSRGKANRLGFLSSLPKSSFLSLQANRRHVTTEDGVNKKIPMSASSRNKARLQFLDILEEILNSKQSSSVSSLPSNIEEYRVEMMASTREDKIEEQVDQLIHDFTEECVTPFVHHITNFIKLGNNFGIRDTLLEKLLKLTSNFLNTYINVPSNYHDTFMDLFTRMIKFLPAGSEKLVRSEQLSRTDRVVLEQLLRLFVTNLGNTLPNSRDGTNSFDSIISDLAKLISMPFDSEHTLKFLNNSINFLLTQLDNPVLFTWGDDYREAIKSFANSAMPFLFNSLHGLEPSREERMNLLKSMIKITFAAFNIETMDIDKVFQLLFSSEKSEEELNAELQPLIDLIFQNISTALKDVTNGGIYIKGCESVAKEAIHLTFTRLPGLLDAHTWRQES